MNTMTTTEAEKLFLGQIIQHPEKLIDIEVGEEHFQTQTHKIIFNAIKTLETDNQVIDVISITTELNKINKNGKWMPMLGEYCQNSFAHTFFKTSQQAMLSLHKEREINRIVTELREDFDSDRAIQELMNINKVSDRYSFGIKQAVITAIEKAQESAKKDGVVGIPTGLKKLDEKLGGLQQPDLIIIGARPSMGKTAFALNLMLNNNCPVGFFSTEQPHEQIGLRAISSVSGVSASKIRTADFEDNELKSMSYAVTQLQSKDIYIYDKSYLTITELMREARRMKYNHDVKVIYVDYIQRVKANSENRRLEVAEVATGLKSLARELKIPVVALAQVNRTVEQRADKRPHMGDLLESGVIEQEADTVILLYRDEVYNENSDQSGIMEILIDKNRHGPIGKILTAWIADTMQVKDLAY